MRLIGMLDSPYVRRVAVSMNFMKLPFHHESISVFRDMDAFQAINPVVKAPTFVLDDGTVLMDSQLILEYLERIAPPGCSLLPADPSGFIRCLRIQGLALAACEKSVQVVYERNLRPGEKQHQPWLERVIRQAQAAFRLLEAEARHDGLMVGGSVTEADITTAIAWRFARERAPDVAPLEQHRALDRHSQRMEAAAEFQAAPFDLNG